MPSSTTKKKRTKRPDVRPNAKRRRKEHQAAAEKDRLDRVAKNEAKGKIVEVPRLANLPRTSQNDIEQQEGVEGPSTLTAIKGQELRKDLKAPIEIRVRALHKILRQIQALEAKEKAGVKLDDAQKKKVARFDAVISELEEIQNLDSDREEEEENEEREGEQKERNKKRGREHEETRFREDAMLWREEAERPST